MGSSLSFTPRIINTIYVSFSEKDIYAVLLHEELILNKMSNFFGPIECIVKEYGVSPEQLIPVVKNIMSNSSIILIYISRKTAGSYYQAIEINNAGQSNAKLIYIMTDKTYTPENTPFLKEFVQNTKWLPAYDDDTLDRTIEELVPILKTTN